MRWDTDPTWRVVQAAPFTAAALACAQYGYVGSFVALQHEKGERWDISRASGRSPRRLSLRASGRRRASATWCGHGGRRAA
jgi:hypothetical protein